MCEAHKRNGLSQHLEAHAATPLRGVVRGANALLDDQSHALRAAAAAELPRRRLAELRELYLKPDPKPAKPRHAEASAESRPAAGSDRRWQPAGVGTVLLLVLACVVALARMGALMTA